MPAVITQLAERLKWIDPNTGRVDSVAYKWIKIAEKDRVVSFDPVSRPKNEKRLLPGPVEPIRFLPSPRRIFDARSDLGEAISYADPNTRRVHSVAYKWIKIAEKDRVVSFD